jgi:hypothetical protein
LFVQAANETAPPEVEHHKLYITEVTTDQTHSQFASGDVILVEFVVLEGFEASIVGDVTLFPVGA